MSGAYRPRIPVPGTTTAMVLPCRVTSPTTRPVRLSGAGSEVFSTEIAAT